jgi:hypothetical protein
MARSRNIKPGFFKNEILAELSPETRLLFIGLWCIADREGRFEDRPKKIKMELFAADDFSVSDSLDQLASSGFLVRYEVDRRKYVQIVNFIKHQMPHHKEVPSDIPAPPGSPQVTRHAYDVSPDVRSSVFSRDGMKCLRCGTKDSLSIDHIVSLSQGGDNAITNLQTLCTSCNSAKGGATKDYRKTVIESTLMQRQANDGASCPSDSLIPDSLIPDSLIPDSLIPDSSPLIPDSSVAPAALSGKAPRKRGAKPVPDSAAVWASYSEAYERRYSVPPVRNASVNAHLAQLVGKLGAAEAPFVAAHFVKSQNGLYVAAMHPTNLLLRDAEKLRTEWATGRQVTRTQAQQADRTQTNANAFDGLLAAAEMEYANAKS